jgi:hypothetical protein
MDFCSSECTDKGLDLWEPPRAMCSCHTMMCRRMWHSGLGSSPRYSLQVDTPDCAAVGLLYKACVFFVAVALPTPQKSLTGFQLYMPHV